MLEGGILTLALFRNKLNLSNQLRVIAPMWDAKERKGFIAPDSAKSKITNRGKLKNKQRHSEALLNSFPINGNTLGLCPWNQKLQNFESPKVFTLGDKGLTNSPTVKYC